MSAAKSNVRQIRMEEFDNSIQRGIPIPKKRSGPVSRYRALMERLATVGQVGDSFFVQGGVRQTAIGYAQEYGIRITTRQVGNGIRIWRVA